VTKPPPQTTNSPGAAFPIHFRRATVHDVEALSRSVIEGVEDYPSFAPAGWTAPSFEAEVDHLRDSLADQRVWCLVAESDEELVGQITLVPAAAAPHPVDDPTLGHVSNLFVRRDFWGAGLARDLHRAAVMGRSSAASECSGRSWPQAKRRFYEREGWLPAGDEFDDPTPGLRMVEYRYRLGDR
jgi:GNAT superfamily N-acetyltransferase